MLSKTIESFAKKLGVVVVPEWRAVHLDWERHIARLFEYLNVDCVFDVGANVGQYGTMLRKYIGYRGRIISFEPNPAAFQSLEKVALRDQLWHVEPIAFGSTTGNAEFYAYELSELGSFRRFNESAHAPRNKAGQTITVSVSRLDSFFDDAKRIYGFQRPFLKLDTQGFDLEVARGAGDCLTEFVGLQSEISFKPIYDNAPDYISALTFYRSAGFVVSRLVPIHEINFPELVEMDVIMTRHDCV